MRSTLLVVMLRGGRDDTAGEASVSVTAICAKPTVTLFVCISSFLVGGMHGGQHPPAQFRVKAQGVRSG